MAPAQGGAERCLCSWVSADCINKKLCQTGQFDVSSLNDFCTRTSVWFRSSLPCSQVSSCRTRWPLSQLARGLKASAKCFKACTFFCLWKRLPEKNASGKVVGHEMPGKHSRRSPKLSCTVSIYQGYYATDEHVSLMTNARS